MLLLMRAEIAHHVSDGSLWVRMDHGDHRAQLIITSSLTIIYLGKYLVKRMVIRMNTNQLE
jgi:hypothetical protein